jgi:spore photoproduct lyase
VVRELSFEQQTPCQSPMSSFVSLLDIQSIYLEPGVESYSRGRDILARFPAAERIPIASHWRNPELREGEPADFLRPKRTALVLGVKKGLGWRPNGRSADFIAPSSSNGCAMACAYCYVARRKGHANPITTFVNIQDICGAIARHAAKQGAKPEPNQVDRLDWVYDLGENGDLSVDALVSDNVRDLVALFRGLPNAKASFATKYVNPGLLGYDPQWRTRIRMSLMPAKMAKLLACGRPRLRSASRLVCAGQADVRGLTPRIWAMA